VKRAQFAILAVAPAVTARYVRVQSTNDTDTIYGLTEVGVWP
jgi:hypothetical protein